MHLRTLLDEIELGWRSADSAKVAVVSSDGGLTWGDLLAGARGIAATLSSGGVGRGSRVGIWMEKTPQAVQALLGVLLSGAAYVPLDPRSPVQRVRMILANCGMSGLIVDAAHAPQLPEALEATVAPPIILVDGPPTIFGQRLDVARRAAPRNTPRPSPEDVAYILYTSGSTGVPKGVVHTHASGGAFVEWVRTRFGTRADDVFSSHAPLHFDLSISDLFVALASGATVRLLSTTETMLPAYLVRQLDAWGITVWYSVPSALTAMLESGLEKTPPKKLRLLFFAGEVFPTPQLRRLRRTLPEVKLYNFFGPTETNVCTYYEVPPELPESLIAPIPIGIGCENLDTFVLDDEGQEVHEVGVEGTLWVSGGNLMKGYWNDPDRTARTLQPDPRGREGIACNTGDRVRLLPDGNYEFRGRRDHLVKTRGYRVELGEIEATLASHPEVLEAVAVAVPDPELGNRLLAFVVPRAGASIEPEALRAHCQARLPLYMVPEAIAVRAQLPRTSTGKADRGALTGELKGRAE